MRFSTSRPHPALAMVAFTAPACGLFRLRCTAPRPDSAWVRRLMTAEFHEKGPPKGLLRPRSQLGRRDYALADLLFPLRVTVSTAAFVLAAISER